MTEVELRAIYSKVRYQISPDGFIGTDGISWGARARLIARNAHWVIAFVRGHVSWAGIGTTSYKPPALFALRPTGEGVGDIVKVLHYERDTRKDAFQIMSNLTGIDLSKIRIADLKPEKPKLSDSGSGQAPPDDSDILATLQVNHAEFCWSRVVCDRVLPCTCGREDQAKITILQVLNAFNYVKWKAETLEAPLEARIAADAAGCERVITRMKEILRNAK